MGGTARKTRESNGRGRVVQETRCGFGHGELCAEASKYDLQMIPNRVQKFDGADVSPPSP